MGRMIPGMAALFAAMLFLSAAGAGERELRIFTWVEYIDMDVVAEFEAEHGCKVTFKYYTSDDEAREGLLGGDKSFDLATVVSYMAAPARRAGRLADLDKSLIPNLKNVEPKFFAITGDAESSYSVPYTRSVAGIGYNMTDISKPTLSWSVFDNAAFKGRMTMLTSVRESLGAALRYLGYSLNTTNAKEIEEAGRVLERWKGNMVWVETDKAMEMVAGGQLALIHTYNGDMGMVIKDNPFVEFFVPKEGSSLSVDIFVIPADSAEPELAYAFINHMLDADNAARNMDAIRYYMPIPNAIKLLDDKLKFSSVFTIPRNTMARCEVIQDLGPDNRKYEEVWERVMGDVLSAQTHDKAGASN